MDYTRKAVRGAGITLFFMLSAAFFGYLIRMTLARNLDPVKFGLFYSIIALISFFSLFKDLGLGQALVKLIPQFVVRKKYNLIKSAIVTVLASQVIISFSIALLLIILSKFLAVHYFREPTAITIIILLTLAHALRPVSFMFSYIFQGFQAMFYYASVDFVRFLSILVLCLAGFAFYKGPVVPSVAYLVTPFILLLIYIPLLLRKTFPDFLKIKFEFKKYLLRKLFHYGIPLMLVTTGWVLLGYTDTMMLTYFKSLKDVGLYNVALPTAGVLRYIGIALMAVVLPMASELWERGKKDKLVIGMHLLYKYSFIVVFPLVFLMLSFPRLIIIILFGSAYKPAALALMILAIGLLFQTIARVNFGFLSGIGKPSTSTKIILSVALLNIILNFFLIPRFGIEGAAFTTTFGSFVMMSLSLLFTSKSLALRIPYISWIKNLIAALVFLFIVYKLKIVLVLNPLVEFFIVAFVSGIAYIIILFLLRVLRIRELKGLLRSVV